MFDGTQRKGLMGRMIQKLGLSADPMAHTTWLEIDPGIRRCGRLVDSPVFDVSFLVEHGDLHVEDELDVVAQLADERGTGF